MVIIEIRLTLKFLNNTIIKQTSQMIQSSKDKGYLILSKPIEQVNEGNFGTTLLHERLAVLNERNLTNN